MRIQTLDISGFKSFGGRALLHFDRSITAIVGPNGCGKSNVVDAIRWCLGEMSAKHLRGGVMQDVIFAGSQKHGPASLAQVTMTFVDDAVDTPDLSQPPSTASEVAVTRQLYRDGTSRYLINNVAVRLRDVVDLFLGTGIGAQAYSIIEQNQIGAVVAAKPLERRAFIEEVAGISKFKLRKKTALRRMEATEQNIAVMQQIGSEMQRQLLHLEKQAHTARQYLQWRDRLRALEIHQAAHALLGLKASAQFAQQQKQHWTQALAQSVDEQNRLQAQTTAASAKLSACYDQVLQCGKALSAQLAQQSALEVENRHVQQSFASEQRRIEQTALQVKQDVAELNTMESELATAVDTVSHTKAQVETLATALSASQQASSEHADALHRVQLQVAEREKSLRHTIEQVASLQAQQNHLQQQDQQSLQQQAELTAQIADNQRKLQQSEQTCQQLQSSLALLIEQHAAAQNARQTAMDQLKRLDADEVCLNNELRQLTETLHKAQARAESLQEIVTRLDGCGDGVKALKSEWPQWASLPLLASCVEVDKAHEMALESMLGERLQALVLPPAQAPSSVVEALAWLIQQQKGRGYFVYESNVAAATLPNVSAEPGFVALASDLVKTRAPHMAGIVQALLTDVVVCQDLATALRMVAQYPQLTAVSLTGEMATGKGLVVGGSGGTSNLLSTHRQIRELLPEIIELKAARQILLDKQQDLIARQAQCRCEQQEAEKLWHGLALQKVASQKDGDVAQQVWQRCQERAASLVQRLALLQQARDSNTAAQQSCAQRLTQAQQESAALEQQLGELHTERQGLQAQQSSLQQDYIQKSEALAAAKQAWLASEHRLQRLQERQRQLGVQIEQAHQTIGQGESLLMQLQEKHHGYTQALSELTASVAQWQADEQAHKQEHASLQQAGEALGSQREQLQATLRAQERALHDFAGRCQQLQLQQQQLQENVKQAWDIDLYDTLHDYHHQPMLSKEQNKQIKSLQQQIKHLGPVSLQAIDDYQVQKQRYEALLAQKDDLERALLALQEVVDKLEVQSNARFETAFEQVAHMFEKVYPKLFRGGVAHLSLVSVEGTADMGVEIVACPPGKKLQSVQLLSGGEKALTATAFIFALFLIKPSPFCILDEVDAPLDEANVARFNALLKEIAPLSQFIVITHNKQTMLSAEKLFGVTMQEPGCSTVVHVKLEHAHGHVAA